MTALLACALWAAPLLTSTQARTLPATAWNDVAGEWEALTYGMLIDYEAPRQVPKTVNVEQWVKVAKDSGMRYVVMVVKQGDGTCLWPTKHSDRVLDRDLVKEFTAACKRHGIRVGLQYALGGDSFNQARLSPAEYESFAMNQVSELLSGYGPVSQINFTGGVDLGAKCQQTLNTLYAKVKALQPNCLVAFVQTAGTGQVAESFTVTYGGKPNGGESVRLWPKDIVSTFRMLPAKTIHDPRVEINGRRHYVSWETADTLTAETTFRRDAPPKSVWALNQSFERAVNRRSNFLLAVPLDETGQIGSAYVKRLREHKDAMRDPNKLRPNLIEKAKLTASTGQPGFANVGDVLTPYVWSWTPAANDRAGWLQAEFEERTEVDSAFLSEPRANIRAFEIRGLDEAGSWKVLHTGKTLPEDGTVKFAHSGVRAIRFVALDAEQAPALSAFELYNTKAKRE